jgi:hypothetical protein
VSCVASPNPTQPFVAPSPRRIPLFRAKSNHKQAVESGFKMTPWLLQGIGTGLRDLVVLLARDA